MNIYELVNNISTLANTRVNGHIKPFLIIGAPGCGKTTILETAFADAWSKLTGKPTDVIVEILSNKEAPDVRGLPIPMRNTEWPTYRYAKPDLLDRIERSPCFHDGQVLVVLDEFTKCDSAMQKVTADLLQNYRIGEYPLPSNVWLVATGNRQQDSSGETRQHAMLTNRLPRINVELPIEYWARHARAIGLPPISIAFAERFPTHFAEAVPPRDGAFCTYRSFTELSKYLGTWNATHAKDLTHVEDNTFTRSLAYGMIGEAAALEFFAFARVAEQLPTRQEVLSSPDTAVIPMAHAVDAQYAACNMAMSLAMEDVLHLAPALKYIMRLPTIELAVKAMVELNKSHGGAITMNNPEAARWLSQHKALVFDANI